MQLLLSSLVRFGKQWVYIKVIDEDSLFRATLSWEVIQPISSATQGWLAASQSVQMRIRSTPAEATRVSKGTCKPLKNLTARYHVTQVLFRPLSDPSCVPGVKFGVLPKKVVHNLLT